MQAMANPPDNHSSDGPNEKNHFGDMSHNGQGTGSSNGVYKESEDGASRLVVANLLVTNNEVYEPIVSTEQKENDVVPEGEDVAEEESDSTNNQISNEGAKIHLNVGKECQRQKTEDNKISDYAQGDIGGSQGLQAPGDHENCESLPSLLHNPTKGENPSAKFQHYGGREKFDGTQPSTRCPGSPNKTDISSLENVGEPNSVMIGSPLADVDEASLNSVDEIEESPNMAEPIAVSKNQIQWIIGEMKEPGCRRKMKKSVAETKRAKKKTTKRKKNIKEKKRTERRKLSAMCMKSTTSNPVRVCSDGREDAERNRLNGCHRNNHRSQQAQCVRDVFEERVYPQALNCRRYDLYLSYDEVSKTVCIRRDIFGFLWGYAPVECSAGSRRFVRSTHTEVEMRKKKERISNIIKNSEVVKTVTGMGFSEDTVRHVLEEKIDSGNVTDQNNIFDSATSLLDAVMEYENRMEEEEEEQPGPPADEELSHLSFHSMSLSGAIGGSLGPSPGSGLIPQVRSFAEDEEMMEDRDIYGSINESGQAVAQNAVAPVDKKSLQETLDKMEEERQCKVCFSNPADMVFVPCGHMICCMDCTQALRQCPVCRKKIEKAIKTYVK